MTTSRSSISEYYVWFRPQRGGLDESMAAKVRITSKEELAGLLKTTPERIEFRYIGRDERVGWNAYLVSVDGRAVGYSSDKP